MTIWLQSRSNGKAWQTVRNFKTERAAYAHLAAMAENSAAGTYRLATWDTGSPYDGVSNPTTVIATREGCATS